MARSVPRLGRVAGIFRPGNVYCHHLLTRSTSDLCRQWPVLGGTGLASSTQVLDDCGHAGMGQGRVEMGGDGAGMESQQARPGVSRRQPTKWGMIEETRGRVPAKKDRGGGPLQRGGRRGRREKNSNCEREFCVGTRADASIPFRRCLPSTKVAARKGRARIALGFGNQGHDGRSLPPRSELTCSSSNDQAWRGGKVWVHGTHMRRGRLQRYKKQGGALVIFSPPEDKGKNPTSPSPSSLRFISGSLTRKATLTRRLTRRHDCQPSIHSFHPRCPLTRRATRLRNRHLQQSAGCPPALPPRGTQLQHSPPGAKVRYSTISSPLPIQA